MEVSKWEDLISGALCVSSGTNSVYIVFITAYVYSERICRQLHVVLKS